MKKFWPIIKNILVGWGILCAIGTIALGGILIFQLGPGNKDSDKTASKHDVRHVLNWCNLGDGRIEEVLHSHVSARSFTGDHLDAHAIRISHVEEKELLKGEFGDGWSRGDQVSGVLSDALDFVEAWLPSQEIPWFLSEEEVRSSEVYVYPVSIYCHGTRPSAVELIFVRPKDRLVFFFGVKS